jgi:hypothetical protein
MRRTLRGLLDKASPASTAVWNWVKFIVINNLGQLQCCTVKLRFVLKLISRANKDDTTNVPRVALPVYHQQVSVEIAVFLREQPLVPGPSI